MMLGMSRLTAIGSLYLFPTHCPSVTDRAWIGVVTATKLILLKRVSRAELIDDGDAQKPYDDLV
jgi:hypothetical protein